MNKKYVTYKNFKKYIKILDKKIKNLDWNPEIILSINRGGCIPGVYLSHIKGIKHHVINISNNNSINSYKYILDKYSYILIIDDINDSGNTLSKIKKLLKDYISKLRFAVLINNMSSSFKIDYFSTEIDKNIDNSWIVFPWENIDL